MHLTLPCLLLFGLGVVAMVTSASASEDNIQLDEDNSQVSLLHREERAVRAPRLNRMREGRSRKGVRRRKRCGDWVFEDCVAVNGSCGKGVKQAHREDPSCKDIKRSFDCDIPCEGGVPTVLESSDDAVIHKGRGRQNGEKDGAREGGRGRGRGKGKGQGRGGRRRGGRKEGPQGVGQPGRKEKINGRRKGKVEGAERQGGRRKGQSCQYNRTETECDPVSNTQTFTIVLVEGDPEKCKPSKTVTKTCEDVCKYGKSAGQSVGDCDAATNERSIILTLKRGDPNVCEASKVVTRPCRDGQRKPRKAIDCKYTRGEWSECDESTNTMSRNLTLKKSDPERCETSKVIRRKCKKACRYSKGDWTECNPQGFQFREDQLLPGKLDEGCEPTRTVRNKCKKGKNKQDKIKNKPCQFGDWGEFGECQNGVSTKTRPVISGGPNCQRRAVKTKSC